MKHFRLNISTLALLLVITCFSACTKSPEGSISVTTKAVTEITETSAKTGGSVTSTGYSVGDCGVCYGESHNPSLNNSFTKDHEGDGSFSSTLSNLKSGTKYYVRAYAKTSSGIEYGDETSFTTKGGYTINVFANPTAGGTVTGAGDYQEGQNCTVTATAKTGYIFTYWTENGTQVSTNANYSFTVMDSRTLVAQFNLDSGQPTYVDLGLPSGLLWATYNIGANSPEENGDYFAWAETQPKSIYSWDTYQYCKGSNKTLIKYCNNANYGYNGFFDNLTTLEAYDDAATANWGSGWHIPTQAEWQELLNNTTSVWTTQNGVNGRLFVATNGNSLFLPAGGFFGSSLSNVGTGGNYLSRSLNTNGFPYCTYALFISSGDCYLYNNNFRCQGLSVRAVFSNRQH